jgi:hypothetical protein
MLGASRVDAYVGVRTDAGEEFQSPRMSLAVVDAAEHCPPPQRTAAVGAPPEVTVFDATTETALVPLCFICPSPRDWRRVTMVVLGVGVAIAGTVLLLTDARNGPGRVAERKPAVKRARHSDRRPTILWRSPSLRHR